MATKQATPGAVTKIRISKVVCDVQAGPLRCVAHLASATPSEGVKAIWRNEVGGAAFTPPRAANA